PDSFSDGGRYNHIDQGLRHTEQMIKDGATIIDVGGESTRPNASPVSEQEEIDRVIKVVEAINHNFGEQVWVSVDTSSPNVMILASQVGAKIWNDVRALTRPDAIATAAKLDIPVMLMHMRGEPTTMNQLDNYQDLYTDVITELQ
ncbi:dihydropteroate synthase, partial [Klebsiella pneumoniae]|uniref:dihydropteroate synthase n=1 Tax=Klebsiella pneumoniae TaxID=573 RepID=UPI003C77958D